MKSKIPHRSSILYIDDEVSNLTNFKFVFRKYYDIHLAETVEEGFEIIKQQEIHLIIADQRMPRMTGAMFLAQMAKENPRIARIIITGYSDIDAVVDAINRGRVYHYVSKPWDPTQFKVVIDNALEVFWLKKDNDQLVENLQAINEELDTFLYRSSHDLRRPITTVLGLAEVAQLTLKEQEGLMLFDKVRDTAVNMNKMLRKLYMVNDLHAGIEETEPVNFGRIKAKIEEEFSQVIAENQVDFEFVFDPDMKFGAPDRLIRNIIFNLVENALIFRREEHPKVHVNMFCKAGEGLFIIVEDNGVGILADYSEKIFEMYVIANETSDGNGLGLYVVKRTLDVLNGRVIVSSEVNKGSIFEVFIPYMAKDKIEKTNQIAPKSR